MASEEYWKKAFTISGSECQNIDEWCKIHWKTKHNGRGCGAIGGEYSYIFTPTSIGIIGVVKCVCGETFEFRSL